MKFSFITYIVLILLFCSCIETPNNLYSPESDDSSWIKSDTIKGDQLNYFYPFDQENGSVKAEIIFKTINAITKDQIQIDVPKLKYNKSLLVMLTVDDCHPAALSRVWASIHDKPISNSVPYPTPSKNDPTNVHELYYHAQQLIKGDIPPNYIRTNKTLGFTDGCKNEVRFSLVTTTYPEKESMNREIIAAPFHTASYSRFYQPSTLAWSDIAQMLNYGCGLSLHNVELTKEYATNVDLLVNHLKTAQKIVQEKLKGRSCKMLSQPDNNTAYITAAKQIPSLQTFTAQQNSTILTPLQVEGDLNQATIYRLFKTPKEILQFIQEQCKLSKEDRKAINIGVHNTNNEWILLLSTINDTYGKDGDDSVWFPSQEEYYEYNYYRIHSNLHLEQIDENTIKLVIDLKGGEHFYFPSITVNLRGIKKEDLKELTSNDCIKGFSSSNFEDGMMLNIDCRKFLVEHAEHFVEGFEKDRSNTSNKTDALYFVNQLKESTRKLELLNRIKK